jgi:hypothetical protein
VKSEVTELIDALRTGTMTLEEVARRFRERSWPDAVPVRHADLIHTLDDPDPYVPGSFDDVSAAFHRKDLTLHEYGVLAEAASEAIDAGHRQKPSRPNH